MSKTAMTDLKLAKPPDRTPVKITITVSPNLNKALQTYALYPNSGHVSPAEESRPRADPRYLGTGETLFAEIGRDARSETWAAAQD